MEAEANTQRLNEDAALAKACNVNGTPAIFVNGRRVDTLAATEVGFWNALAESYWQEIGLPRPASTRPK
jgi:protein-disulfide isomerase